MLLVVDVGNTNTSFSVTEGDEWKAFFSIMTKTPRTGDEYCVAILEQFMVNKLSVEAVDGCIISSVVPGVTQALITGIKKLFNVNPIQVGTGIKTGVKIKLANPQECGADRIVDLAAAYDEYGGPTMVIDFGTATTYDLIEADGTFRHGLTCPGIVISANALWNDTAKLPEIEIKLPNSILAYDTISSMQAGLLYGYIGQTEYIIKKVKEAAGLDQMKVVATGGLGKIIADATDMIDVYDRMLTMKGLKLLYKKNCK